MWIPLFCVLFLTSDMASGRRSRSRNVRFSPEAEGRPTLDANNPKNWTTTQLKNELANLGIIISSPLSNKILRKIYNDNIAARSRNSPGLELSDSVQLPTNSSSCDVPELMPPNFSAAPSHTTQTHPLDLDGNPHLLTDSEGVIRPHQSRSTTSASASTTAPLPVDSSVLLPPSNNLNNVVSDKPLALCKKQFQLPSLHTRLLRFLYKPQ